MFVPATVFTDKNVKGKETTSDATKHHHRKEEANISKSKVQNSELELNKKI
jgi:hypothetical protein